MMPKLNELGFRIQQTQDQINKYQSSIDFNNSQMDGLKGEILHLGEVKKLLIRYYSLDITLWHPHAPCEFYLITIVVLTPSPSYYEKQYNPKNQDLDIK